LLIPLGGRTTYVVGLGVLTGRSRSRDGFSCSSKRWAKKASMRFFQCANCAADSATSTKSSQ
jgi:hypothetical protein